MTTVSKLTQKLNLTTAMSFADDADLVVDGIEAEMKMLRMLKTHDDSHTATKGCIEEDKSNSLHRNGRIADKKMSIEVNERKIQSISSTKVRER